MKEVFEVPPTELLTATTSHIDGLRPATDSPAARQIQSIINRSRGLFGAEAEPRGITRAVSRGEFSEICRGRGENDDNTPLELVVEDALSLRLFAVTIGRPVCDRIKDHFAAGELAEGYILDQIASFAADELAQVAARKFAESEGAKPGIAALPYSPGYCGWHVSGQAALFSALEPGEIEISLNDSCLMSPIKSVSGVLVLAPVAAHDFSPAFPCCATCTTMACQERVAELKR